MNKSYRWLGFALVTKVACVLHGAIQLWALHHETRAALPMGEMPDTGWIGLVASADTPVWIIAQIMAGLWLARAAKDGLIGVGKGALPRSLGRWFLLGFAASMLADLAGYAWQFLQSFVALRGVLPLIKDVAATGTVVTKFDLPIAFYQLAALRCVIISLLQLALIVAFRKLVVRVEAGEPPAESTPPEEPAEPSPEGFGFGWPSRRN